MNESAIIPIHDPALSMARQSLYRCTSLCLLDSRAGAWQQLRAIKRSLLLSEAAALVRSELAAIPGSLVPDAQALAGLDPRFVLSRLPKTRAKFNDNYERTFGLLVSSNCPPYEMEYINSKFDFQRSNGMADIAGFYRAFGLERSSIHPERHDHIVLELEFMAYVIGLEHQAMQREAPEWQERAAICRLAQQRFLGEHLAWWTPVFAKLLAMQDPSGFYEAVGGLLRALVAVDRALLGVETIGGPSAPNQVAPSTIERPEQCEGCALGP